MSEWRGRGDVYEIRWNRWTTLLKHSVGVGGLLSEMWG